MQTFLPYADFAKSAACLDSKRLNKQILECKQILAALTGESKGYINHPAVKQWIGLDVKLRAYGMCLTYEYALRNNKRHAIKFITHVNEISIPPPWLGYEPYHASHRSVLLAKDFAHYSQFGWSEKPAEKFWNKNRWSYPYIWPSKMEEFSQNTKGA
jgi:hypothetical protein